MDNAQTKYSVSPIITPLPQCHLLRTPLHVIFLDTTVIRSINPTSGTGTVVILCLIRPSIPFPLCEQGRLYLGYERLIHPSLATPLYVKGR